MSDVGVLWVFCMNSIIIEDFFRPYNITHQTLGTERKKKEAKIEGWGNA